MVHFDEVQTKYQYEPHPLGSIFSFQIGLILKKIKLVYFSLFSLSFSIFGDLSIASQPGLYTILDLLIYEECPN